MRIASGLGLLVCAAVVALATGGGALFGGLGGIFGGSGTSLQVADAAAPAGDIVAAPAQPRARRGVTAHPRAHSPLGVGNPYVVRPRATHRQSPASHQPPSAPAPQPAPAPAVPVPAPPQPPPPSGGQTVSTVGETVKQVTNSLPPPTKPITGPVDNAVDQVVKTCRGLPVCP